MTSEQELERARERQRVINAFHRVFKSPDGEVVLNSLKAYYEFDRSCFRRPMPGLAFDPIAAAHLDGTHEPIRLILRNLAAPVAGDADISEPKTKIVKG